MVAPSIDCLVKLSSSNLLPSSHSSSQELRQATEGKAKSAKDQNTKSSSIEGFVTSLIGTAPRVVFEKRCVVIGHILNLPPNFDQLEHKPFVYIQTTLRTADREVEIRICVYQVTPRQHAHNM